MELVDMYTDTTGHILMTGLRHLMAVPCRQITCSYNKKELTKNRERSKIYYEVENDKARLVMPLQTQYIL